MTVNRNLYWNGGLAKLKNEVLIHFVEMTECCLLSIQQMLCVVL